MVVTTKYSVNDKVYYLNSLGIKPMIITSINIYVVGDTIEVLYNRNTNIHSGQVWAPGIQENKCYATKQELIKSL